ncbi:MAG: hypothetical protein LBE31_00765 [Deltaproteobacteria bacterium]|jgi:hypothetical protein|nr:hypothetical protein [Deltaproteobacteria bacterium]
MQKQDPKLKYKSKLQNFAPKLSSKSKLQNFAPKKENPKYQDHQIQAKKLALVLLSIGQSL